MKSLILGLMLITGTAIADNSTYTGPYLVKKDANISRSFEYKVSFECKVYFGAVVRTKNVFGINLTERKDIFFSPELHTLIEKAADGAISIVRTIPQDSEISYYAYNLGNNESAEEVLLKKVERKEVTTNQSLEAANLVKLTDLLCD